MSGKVFLVTGASRGIGHALCCELAGRGHRVYGAARSGCENAPFTPITLDVTDPASAQESADRIIEQEGGIDVLVNNAGSSFSGPAEEVSTDTARRIFETNYMGTVNMIKAVAPHMRERGSGDIVNIGSAGGRIGVPFQSHYTASKFAVEGLSESLFHELRPFGIRVLLIEPGDVGTEIWSTSEHYSGEGSVYAEALARFHKVKAREMGKGADPPERVAKQIAEIILSDTGKLRHPVAKGARLILAARKILPDRLFLPVVGRNYRTGR
ncbi:MAG: SDR family oxidoreductase [bacterium]